MTNVRTVARPPPLRPPLPPGQSLVVLRGTRRAEDTHVSLVPYLLARDALHLLGCPVNTAVPPPGSR